MLSTKVKAKCGSIIIVMMKQIILFKEKKEFKETLLHTIRSQTYISSFNCLFGNFYSVTYDDQDLTIKDINKQIQSISLSNINPKCYLTSSVQWILICLLLIIYCICTFTQQSSLINLYPLFSIASLLITFNYGYNAFQRLIHKQIIFLDNIWYSALILAIISLFSSNGYSYCLLTIALLCVMLMDDALNALIHYRNFTYLNRLTNASKQQILLKTGNDQFLPTNKLSIAKGDIVSFKSGQWISVDGTVINGSCHVDQSLVDGKSNDYKTKNSLVYSGSKVNDGYIEILVNKPYEQSLLSQLISAFQKAYTSNTLNNINNLLYSDSYNKLLIGISLVISIVIAFIAQSIIIGCIGFAFALFAISLFAILKTDLLQLSALSNAFSQHVVMDSGDCFDHLRSMDQLLLQYQGLIEKGAQVADVLIDNSLDTTIFNHIVYQCHRKQKDPVSAVILNYLKNQNIKDENLTLTRSIYAKGLDNIIHGATLDYGTIDHYQQLGIDVTAFERIITTYTKQGKSCLLYSKDQQIIGLISISDLMDTSFNSLSVKFKNDGVNVILCDQQDQIHADACANVLSIDNTLANCNEQALIKWHKEHSSSTNMLVYEQPYYPIANAYASLSVCVSNQYDSQPCNIHILQNQVHKLFELRQYASLINETITTIRSIGYKSTIALLALTFSVIILFFVDPNYFFYGTCVLICINVVIRIICFILGLKVVHFKFSEAVIDQSQVLTVDIDGCVDSLDHQRITTALQTLDGVSIEFLSNQKAIIRAPMHTAKLKIFNAIRELGYGPKEIHK